MTSRPSGAPPSASTGCSTCSRTARSGGNGENYPPFDLIKLGDNQYRIELAVAGFKPDEIDITAQQNVLIVTGRKNEETQEKGSDFLYRGIANRSFERQFALADHIQVRGADLKDGLLAIELVREIPEAMKPKKINIGGARNSASERSAIGGGDAAGVEADGRRRGAGRLTDLQAQMDEAPGAIPGPSFGLAHAWAAERQRRRRAAVAARELRLVGDPAMVDAIGEAGVGRLAAEVEVGLAGMAERPFADAVVQIEQAGLVGDLGARLGRHQAARRGRRDRRLGVAWALANEAAGADRAILDAVGLGCAAACGRATGRFARSARRRGLSACPARRRGAALALADEEAGFLSFSSPGFTGEGRASRPRRCALPITALRLTPPSSSAIWLAVAPSDHIFFKRSMRSSVQDINE